MYPFTIKSILFKSNIVTENVASKVQVKIKAYSLYVLGKLKFQQNRNQHSTTQNLSKMSEFTSRKKRVGLKL
jgi:hypothetical protein